MYVCNTHTDTHAANTHTHFDTHTHIVSGTGTLTHNILVTNGTDMMTQLHTDAHSVTSQ